MVYDIIKHISFTFKAPSGRPNGNAYLKFVIWCCNSAFRRSLISANFSFSCTVMLPTPSGLPGNVAVLWTTSPVGLILVGHKRDKGLAVVLAFSQIKYSILLICKSFKNNFKYFCSAVFESSQLLVNLNNP